MIMMHQTIETPNMQLAKLLIVRKLRDSTYDIDPSRIEVSLVGDGDWMSQVQFRYPLRRMKVSILSRLGRPEDLTAEQIAIIADEQVLVFSA